MDNVGQPTEAAGPRLTSTLAAPAGIEGQTGTLVFASHLGRRMERIIEALLESGSATHDRAIREVVLAQLATDPPILGRRAVLLACTMATTYVRRFAPGAGWHLIGRNLHVGGGRGDLLFSNGKLWFVDELKAARIRFDDPTLKNQIGRYQQARETYGDAFLGVRVALLRAPSHLLMFPASDASEMLPTARPR